MLRDRGQGFGILVSKVPKETNASYSLQEPSEASTVNLTMQFLITDIINSIPRPLVFCLFVCFRPSLYFCTADCWFILLYNLVGYGLSATFGGMETVTAIGAVVGACRGQIKETNSPSLVFFPPYSIPSENSTRPLKDLAVGWL